MARPHSFDVPPSLVFVPGPGGHDGPDTAGNRLFTLPAYDHDMKRAWSLVRLRAEFSELEASVERAGIALACVYSTSEEFEAAIIRARRVMPRQVGQMQLVLAATAVVAMAAFAAIVL